MTTTNKYKKYSHITETQFRRLIHLFSMDIDVTIIVKITVLKRIRW